MTAAFQTPYQGMARDYLTFRTVNAKRKSAVEILQETKSLFVKSEAVLDAEQRLVKAAKCDGGPVNRVVTRRELSTAKVRKKVLPTHTRSCSDQLQTNLRRLLNSSSKENVTDTLQQHENHHDHVDEDDVWTGYPLDSIGFFSDYGQLSRVETDIQYQSLPDLSASSRESLSCTIHQAMSDSKKSDIILKSNEDMSISTNSDTSIDESIDSSDKSYGKPPSLPKSLQSMGGSFGKVEERLSCWLEPRHVKLVRSKSSGPDESDSSTKLPHQPSLPSDLNEFFQHLGLTTDQYNELTTTDSRSCSPIFFSSRGSSDSTGFSSSCRVQRSQRSTSPPAPSPVSVVQTNARVVKWLCKTSQWL